MSERPAFQSEIFYSVVLGTSRHCGWRNIYAGDGCLIFSHTSGKEAKFYGGSTPGWLERAWNEFTAMAATKETAA